MKVHRHPDGLLLVRTADDALVYGDTVENFVADFGQQLPELPEGMRASLYDSDARVLTFYDAKGNAFPVEGETVDQVAEQILEAADAIVAAQALRREAAAAAATAAREAAIATPAPKPATMPVGTV